MRVIKDKTLKEYYKKCSNELISIKSQKPRENNTPRDWEQRIDEILLLCSALFKISHNESKKLLEAVFPEQDALCKNCGEKTPIVA